MSARPIVKPLRASLALVALAAGGAVVLSACGSSSDSSLFGDKDAGPDPLGGQNNNSGNLGTNLDASMDPDAIYANDPPWAWCGPEGGGPTPPTPPTGTASCPSDKNVQGCPCTQEGQTAACWTGPRKSRDIGSCKDGQTVCTKTGELSLAWGPCNGEVLPNPTATNAADRCSCFSTGQWHIENLVPWFVNYTSDNKWYGFSTTQDPQTGVFQAPTVGNSFPEPPPMPSAQWSKDDLTVDCEGTFTLIYELKAGDFANPSPTDCSLARIELAPTFYGTRNVKQSFPALNAWETNAGQSDCAHKFHDNGGYGEISVKGKDVLCDAIDDGSGNPFVFHRVQYCKAGVTDCGQDGSGTFN
jgi:hypothetical protein